MDDTLKEKKEKTQREKQIPASPRLRVSASPKITRVKILFFGATAEAMGKREIEIDLADETKAENAFRKIVRDFPQLKNHSLLFAVNQEYASGEEVIRDGDELAIFTHVSGG
jgi:molybdopterin converting factor small subunit